MVAGGTANRIIGLLEQESFVALGRRVLYGKCSLFVGAGASIDSGGPSTSELSDLLAERVLMTDQRGIALSDIVDYIDGAMGRRQATASIADRLRGLKPSASLVALAALPWKSVYTTNFDDLFEQAFAQVRPGELQAVVSAHDLDQLRPDLTPLFYLHGSIKQPNDPSMGLVLTQRDLIRAVSQRQAFYHRLTDDATSNEIVYIGFSLGDQDFRATIVEVHDAVDNRQEFIPRGYAVMPNPPAFAGAYWDTQKITLVPGTLTDFAQALETLRSGRAGVQAIPIGATPLLASFLSSVNPASSTAFDLASAFDFPEMDDGEADPGTFFHGAPPTWATLRDRFDAARDVTDTILEWLIVPERDEPIARRRSATQVGLLTGHAGSGKTTLARRLAWSLVHDWTKPALWARQPSRLQFDVVETAATCAEGRLYVFVDDAADSGGSVANVIERSRRRGLHVTFVVIDRENEWTASTSEHPVDADRLFRLARLSDGEARGLVLHLDRANELGGLKGQSLEEQVRILVERAGRDMLVGLREVTEDLLFDEILENEYQHLPTEGAKRAYSTVCTLFQFGVPTRAGILSRITGVPLDRFPESIIHPAKGVILDVQQQPWEQPTFVARHRVIADVIFRRAFPTSSRRSTQIQTLLQNLDPGYRDDYRAFARLINARWLRDRNITISDQDVIYALARRLRPTDAFVVQQEALAWRFRDRSQAARLLNEASGMAPENDTIKHSQAILLLDDAKESDGYAREELLTRAEQAFNALLKREPQNAAPRVALAEVGLLRAEVAETAPERLRLIAGARRVLDEALRAGTISSFLLNMLGRVEEASDKLQDAELEYHQAARAAGPDPHVWISYSRFLLKHKGPVAAASALGEALDLSPIDPQLNHEYARVLEAVEPTNDAAIRKAYGVAIAEPVRGHLSELDFAIYLHMHGAVAEAEAHFQVLRASDLPTRIKSMPRRWVERGGRQATIKAEIVEVRHTRSYLNMPDVEGRVFIQTDELPEATRTVGGQLDVWVYYNSFGPRAVPAGPGTSPDESNEDVLSDTRDGI